MKLKGLFTPIISGAVSGLLFFFLFKDVGICVITGTVVLCSTQILMCITKVETEIKKEFKKMRDDSYYS